MSRLSGAIPHRVREPMVQPVGHSNDELETPVQTEYTRDIAPPWRVSEWGLVEWFVVSQTLLPALLILPGTQALRFPVRLAAFLMPLAILAYVVLVRHMRLPRHPAVPWLIATIAYLCLMIAHPTTNSPVSGFAQIVLYFSVMSPLFWAPSLVRTPEHFRRLVVILLVTNGINATVGVLQVYDPDTWMPGELSRIVTGSQHGLSAVSYIGAEGQRIIRPPGLFDTPGAVAAPGMFAGLLGAVFAASPISKIYRLASAGFALAGIMGSAGWCKSTVCFIIPNQPPAYVIDHLAMGVEHFFLQCVKVLVIQLELELQCPIGHPAFTLE